MDLNDTPEQAEYRAKARSWIAEHRDEAPVLRGEGAIEDEDEAIRAHRVWQRKLAEAGYAGVTWPKEYGGQGLGPLEQVVVNQEINAGGVPGILDSIGVGMLGPTIIAHGTEEQKQRYLAPMLHADEVWCQLFSEPAAGSDLAGIQTRAKLQDDGSWRLSGQKVWTTNAHLCNRAMLIARTDPDQPKHRGITYFGLDLRSPGVEVRPLRQMTGQAEFSEVYLTDVRVPDADRIGDVNDGWRVAMTTLSNERTSIGGGGRAPVRGSGAIAEALRIWHDLPAEGRTPARRDRLIRLWSDAEALRLTNLRAAAMRRSGR